MVTLVLYFINEDKTYETHVAHGDGRNYTEKFWRFVHRASHYIYLSI